MFAAICSDVYSKDKYSYLFTGETLYKKDIRADFKAVLELHRTITENYCLLASWTNNMGK